MSYPAPEQFHGQAYPGPQDHENVYPAGDPVTVPVGVQQTPPSRPDEDFPDFTPDRPRPRFRVDTDVFEGKVEVPTLALMSYAAQAEAAGTDQTAEMDLTLQLIRMLLKKDSADLFIQRLGDEDHPIGPGTFQKVMPYLMEAYGMRPTEPSPELPGGSETTGTKSTENSQVEA